jgi:hypothetical protein
LNDLQKANCRCTVDLWKTDTFLPVGQIGGTIGESISSKSNLPDVGELLQSDTSQSSPSRHRGQGSIIENTIGTNGKYVESSGFCTSIDNEEPPYLSGGSTITRDECKAECTNKEWCDGFSFKDIVAFPTERCRLHVNRAPTDSDRFGQFTNIVGKERRNVRVHRGHGDANSGATCYKKE